ncbi:hypothetical protein C8R43DRAFT_1127202 [Mycena crocata]|nr:hypothetical protein C8R43DRAFT_1127202 [Mycena crocata]
MTDTFYTASGTGSVPAAATTQGSDINAAALQHLNAAMLSLSQAHASPPAPAPVSQPPAPPPNLPAAPVGFQNHGPWLAGGMYVVVPTGPLLPAAQAPGSDDTWYCITKGHYVGITTSNALALNAVVGVTGNAMKSYKSQSLALLAFNDLQRYGMVAVVA